MGRRRNSDRRDGRVALESFDILIYNAAVAAGFFPVRRPAPRDRGDRRSRSMSSVWCRRCKEPGTVGAAAVRPYQFLTGSAARSMATPKARFIPRPKAQSSAWPTVWCMKRRLMPDLKLNVVVPFDQTKISSSEAGEDTMH